MGCLGFSIAGTVLEIGGLVLVLWELGRAQRQEFGRPKWLDRLWGWVQRVVLRREPKAIHLEGTASASASGELTLQVGRGPATLLEDRVERLEKITEDLRREQQEATARLERQISEARSQVGALEQELSRQEQEGEEKRKADLRWHIRTQLVGTGLFVLGAVLSLLGNAVTC